MSPTSLGFGVIEGFYGTPWTHESRLGVLRELADLGLDTFVFAPKNDPQHRSAWSRALGHDDRERLRELFAAARSLGVAFVYGLAPERILGGATNVGARSLFRRDADHDGLADAPFERLRERLLELLELGARDFAFSFDDTWATFVPALATFDKGLLHARVAHRALATLRARDPSARAFLVPAIYHRRVDELSRGAMAYLRGLASLGTDIPIAWTGPHVFSRRIEPGDLTRLERETGLSIWVWSNAITNDWLPLATGEPLGLTPRQKLSFGPIEHLAPGLASRARGVLLNAAREPELTKVSLATLAELKHLGAAYDPTAAHTRALSRVFGAEVLDIARALYSLTKRHPLASPARFEAAPFYDLARDYAAGRATRKDLERALDDVATLEARARAALGERPIMAEIAPTLARARLAAEAAQIALRRADAHRSGDHASAATLERALRKTLDAAAKIPWEAGLEPLFDIARTRVEALAKRP